LIQESDQSFDVLGSGGEGELLLDELQPAQTQAVKTDAALQFREQSFDLLALSLCVLELGRVPEISCPLSRWFVPVDT
jgi:hypothetical protein